MHYPSNTDLRIKEINGSNSAGINRSINKLSLLNGKSLETPLERFRMGGLY